MGNIFVNKGQQLEDAVREGNISKVQELLRDGASMGWKNYVGMNNNQAIYIGPVIMLMSKLLNYY